MTSSIFFFDSFFFIILIELYRQYTQQKETIKARSDRSKENHTFVARQERNKIQRVQMILKK